MSKIKLLPNQTELFIFEIEMALRSGCRYTPMTDYGIIKTVYYKFLLRLIKKLPYIWSKLKPLGQY
jgi:hypothetical protein